MNGKKKNIVLIVTDHQLYRNHSPLRPHYDEFSEDAVVFDNAYCSTPLCAPARRSMLDGLYAHRHGNIYNQSPAPFTEETYFPLLERAGYDNYTYGKWHSGPGTAYDLGVKGFSVPGYGTPYMTKEYRDYLEEMNLPYPEMEIIQTFPNPGTAKDFPGLVNGNPSYSPRGTWCGEQAIGILKTPKETHEAFFLSHLASRQIEKLSSSEKPFHLSVHFWGPHQPYFPTKEYVDMYSGMKIGRYPSLDDDLAAKPGTYRHMNSPLSDENGNLRFPSVFSADEWEKFLKIAYAQTTLIDDAIGMILDSIRKNGLEDDTVVIITSDHGDALASHGGMFDKGSFLTEETVAVPFAVRIPGVKACHSPALISTIDWAPTILDIAGTRFSSPVDGESILPVITGERASIRDRVLIESFGQGYRDRTKAFGYVDTSHMKFVVTENDIPELYDLKSDPYEMKNLALGRDISHERENLVRLCEKYGCDTSWM